MRMAVHALIVAAVSYGDAALAQTVSYDAVRVADTFAESGWQSVEQMMPALIAGLEVQLKSSGATEKASKVLAEEVRKSFNKENLTRAIASALSEQFTATELTDLSSFLRSDVGRKYLKFNKELASNPIYAAPMLKQACEAAKAQLGLFERGSIHGVCGQF